MFYIKKYKYPLFVEDITEIDPEISRFSLEFSSMEKALNFSNNMANYNRAVLSNKYTDTEFIILYEAGNIIRLCFLKDNIPYIIIKYEVLAN